MRSDRIESANMAPSRWDDEEESDSSSPVTRPTIVSRRKFDDEEDEDVLDSWDAAEDSEVEREKAAKAAAAKAKAEAEATANKKSKAQRIQEHKQERQRKADEEEEEDDDESSEDETEKRARLRWTEKDSDLKHAEDLFGDIDLNRKRGTNKAIVVSDLSDPTKAIDLSAMPLFKPMTKEQFSQLTTTLAPLLTAHSKKPLFSLWVQDFAKQLVKELPSAEVKKVASALTTVANEKMKEERQADKGSKKSKAAKTKVSLVASRNDVVDTAPYDDDGLDDDDFM